MQTTPVTYDQLRQSVIAVPPLCRDRDGRVSVEANQRLVDHIQSGGVSTLLYGGNANLYHIRPSEYSRLLQVLEEVSGERTLTIPSVGPAYGIMMDQADVIRETRFPTAMVLPQVDVMTEAGLMRGFRHFVQAIGRPAVLYIKREGYLSPSAAAKLVADGLVSLIKYAIVRHDPSQDDYLRELVDVVDPRLIVSGIGEQPAIVHLTKFGLTGFTSGCVCIAPTLSQRLLSAVDAGDFENAEAIRSVFRPLEDLRNSIHPIRVLHDAVGLAEIAETGPQQPLLEGVSEREAAVIRDATLALLAKEHEARG